MRDGETEEGGRGSKLGIFTVVVLNPLHDVQGVLCHATRTRAMTVPLC